MPGQGFHGGLIPRKYPLTAENLESGMPPVGEHDDQVLGNPPFGQKHLEDLVPKDRLLEGKVKDLPPALLRMGVESIAYQYSRDKIKQVMEREASCIRSQYESVGKFLLVSGHVRKIDMRPG